MVTGCKEDAEPFVLSLTGNGYWGSRGVRPDTSNEAEHKCIWLFRQEDCNTSKEPFGASCSVFQVVCERRRFSDVSLNRDEMLRRLEKKNSTWFCEIQAVCAMCRVCVTLRIAFYVWLFLNRPYTFLKTAHCASATLRHSVSPRVSGYWGLPVSSFFSFLLSKPDF